MSITELLRRLKHSHISINLIGSTIQYTCPRGAMTDDLRNAIQTHKPALIDILRNTEDILRIVFGLLSQRQISAMGAANNYSVPVS